MRISRGFFAAIAELVSKRILAAMPHTALRNAGRPFATSRKGAGYRPTFWALTLLPRLCASPMSPLVGRGFTPAEMREQMRRPAAPFVGRGLAPAEKYGLVLAVFTYDGSSPAPPPGGGQPQADLRYSNYA